MAGPDVPVIDNPVLARQAEILARPPTPGLADGQRHPRARHRCGGGGEVRPSRYADGDGRCRHRAVVALPQVRCRRPALAGPRPLRAVRRPRLDAALCAALPHRPRRHGDRGDQAVPPAPLPRRGPPRIRRAPGHRDHHRPARPGHRHRGRHGDRRTAAGGAVRPLAGGSPHLGDRLGRRHDGGHQPRGRRDRRPSVPVEADGPLRRQPHLDRRRHRACPTRTTC